MTVFNDMNRAVSSFRTASHEPGFSVYEMDQDGNRGELVCCRDLFPGVKAICFRLEEFDCSRPVRTEEGWIELHGCLEGRFECVSQHNRSHYISSGDLAVGAAGRFLSQGRITSGSYRGITVYLQPGTMASQMPDTFRRMEVSMDRLKETLSEEGACHVIRSCPEMDSILFSMQSCFLERNRALLRLRTLELLVYVESLDLKSTGGETAYLSKKQVVMARAVHEILVSDLSRHTTIDQMARDLHIGATFLKNAFKCVYGVSIYQFQKDLRLETAQRMIRETERTFTEIAASLGYTNAAKFSSAFKAKFGITPTAYRQLCLESGRRSAVRRTEEE